MTLSASLAVQIAAQLAGSPDVGSARHTISENLTASFANGTGVNQANNVFADDFSITGGVEQTYDLAGGVTNGLGVTLTFTAIKALVLVNTGTTELTYGGSTPFMGWLGDASDKIKIPAGGFMILTDPSAAGQAVTTGTGDLITIDAASTGAGRIIIIGEA